MHRVAAIAIAGSLALTATTTTARADYACKEPSPTTTIEAHFKPETSLMELASWVMSFTCKNIIFTPEVAKQATKVVIAAPRPMTPKQALQLFVDAIGATGLVVETKPDSIVVKQGPGMPKSCPDTGLASSTNPPTSNPSEPYAYGLDLDVEIKAIDETHAQVSKRFMDKALANPDALAKGVRIVPAMDGDKPIGFKLYAIRPSSPFAHAGFANGDTVKSVNGSVTTSLDNLIATLAKMATAKQLVVDIVRRGKPVTLTITIQ